MLLEIAIAFYLQVPTYDPAKFEALFGSPEDFIQKMEDDISPKLNEYLGLGVACSGFVLCIRALVK